MATSIFFNGRLISVPGSYTEVDASGLETVGLGASGIVAVLGTAEGGRPVSDITEVKDLIRITKPEQVRKTFRSGDLREVGDFLFAPANDADILAGAQQLVMMKVNPATKSAAVLPNPQGDAIDLTSLDYGAFTGQVNISIGTGTTQGKLITIVFEDITESADDIGGDGIFTLTYTKPTGGWDTMTADVEAGGNIVADATRDTVGLDGDVATPLAAPGAIEVVSTNVGDTTQTIKIYGLDGTGTPKTETLTLNGTTPVVGTQAWGAGDVLGAAITGTTAGTVSVDPSGGGADIFTLAPGADVSGGVEDGVAMFANGLLTLTADAATTQDVIFEGLSLTGAPVLEKITLTGTTPVNSAASYSKITRIVLGDLEAARTLTTAAEAAKSLASTQNTIQKAADYYNARFDAAAAGGFVFATLTGVTTFDPDNLDISTSSSNILGPANPEFNADLYAVINWINTNSSFMSAERSSGATGGAPDNTTAPLFLSGGVEGTTTITEYQAALDLLKQVRINTVVPLTGDPAVHAAVDAHCAYMGGIGRSERDGVAGALNGALTNVPTKDEFKQQVIDLNSRHMRLTGQAVDRFNTAGERAEFLPPFTAAIAAGMQAGSTVGTSLTYKFANVLSFRQDASWNPADDAEELIQGGAMFMENVEGVGNRWVRNVTTHLSSSNISLTEASVNEAVNFSTFNLRTNLEFAVGKQGFTGTINATKSIAINTLGLLVDAGVLTQWRSLQFELVVDVLEVSVEIAPVIPINFVQTTVHLVTVPQSA